MRKPLTALAIFVSILCSISSASAAFSDVPNNATNSDAINFLADQRIVDGYPDGTFKPEKKINRAEFLKIVLESAHTIFSAPCDEGIFPDVSPADWFVIYTLHAKCVRLIDGYPDGTFRPSTTINFVEAAKIIVNTLNVPASPTTIWYEGYVRALAEKQAIPLSISSLDQEVTRGDMAEMMYRILVPAQRASRTYEDLAGKIDEASSSPELVNLQLQFPHTDHNFLLIFGSFDTQESANAYVAKFAGGWVLDTSLTTKLAPNHFAAVYGPFSTAAADKSTVINPLDGKEYAVNPYVKDAGRFLWPSEYPFRAESYPPGVLQALLGEVGMQVLQESVIKVSKRDDMGCMRMPSYNFFLYSKTDEALRGDPVPTVDGQGYRPFKGTWLLEETGELRRPISCMWD